MENFTLTESAIFFLQIIRKWAKFIAIFMFVMIGFMVIAGIFMGFALSALSSMAYQSPMPFPPLLLSVLYLVMALIYFFPVLYLYRFAEHLGQALMTRSPEELATSFSYLKKHYTFIGILMIVSLVVMVLGVIVGVIIGVSGILGAAHSGQFSMML
jgi:hypothetical protein